LGVSEIPNIDRDLRMVAVYGAKSKSSIKSDGNTRRRGSYSKFHINFMSFLYRSQFVLIGPPSRCQCPLRMSLIRFFSVVVVVVFSIVFGHLFCFATSRVSAAATLHLLCSTVSPRESCGVFWCRLCSVL